MVRRGGKNRLLTDALREIWHTRSRFFSIFVLALLAVAFLAGLRTTAPDMQYTADQYYDEQNLMDIQVISTLGLTDEDLKKLSSYKGIEDVEGAWSLDAVVGDEVVVVGSLPEVVNLVALEEGNLPATGSECVTEERLMTSLGLELGDTITLELAEGSEDQLVRRTFTVVGVVKSPLYVGTSRGSSSLGSGSVSAFVYIPGENFDLDYYTCAYLTVRGMAELDCYSDEYEDYMEDYLDEMGSFADERAEARRESLISDALEQLEEAREEYDKAAAQAQAELDDAWDQLEEARQTLEDSREELDQGWEDYEEGQTELEEQISAAKAELESGRETLESSGSLLEQAQSAYEASLAAYERSYASYRESLAGLQEEQAQYQADLAEYQAGLAGYESRQAQLEENGGALSDPEEAAELRQLQMQLELQRVRLELTESTLASTSTALETVGQELEQTRTILDQTKSGLDQTLAEYNSGLRQLEEGEAQLAREEANGRQQLADALEQLEDGEEQYASGLKQYEQGVADYEAGKAQAEEELEAALRELEDAEDQVYDIEECEWYLLGRNTNAGLVGYAQDSERVSNLAAIFPVIFFLVAALACLTTMTRMVEEQRTQIGSLKALGFSRAAISVKYIGYAVLASSTGGIVGLAVGCTLIPWVIANAFNIMYYMPDVQFKLQPGICVAAVAAAVLCTGGASLWACFSALTDNPANLMRPKAPPVGKRVFLERIGPLWRRLSFTWKVTMRNLFRYQRRFWMTVIGIGGCTALVVTGFGLHNSIFDILDKQFDEITVYDGSAGLDGHIRDRETAEIRELLDGEEAVSDYLFCYQSSVDLNGEGGAVSGVYIFGVQDLEEFQSFVDLRHMGDDEPVTMPESGVIITQKLSELLDVEVGDAITIAGDRRVNVRVEDIVENYVYHYIYISEDYYAQVFGEEIQDNMVLIRYGEDTAEEETDRISQALMSLSGVVSYANVSAIRDSFTDSMISIDYAVVIVIVSAAALAFVVLYNLTNINITERLRELATLKVLGFYDRETSAYVYRENVFLTFFGIALGLVLGRFLHSWMVLTVEVELVMFGRTAPPYAYALAAVLTVLFSLVVNVAAHFSLKKVDMVESLKTVE